ncbi:MAG: serine acetyltransferase, partial [Muribaculaceae bacterium]|nr:serine acetyltransferase [Muribaculaceae bacterium]
MDHKNVEDILLKNISILAQPTVQESRMVPDGEGPFPSIEGRREIMRLVRPIVFPDFFDSRRNDSQMR